MPVTIGQRQTVVSWWVFYRADSVHVPEPGQYQAWIEEAEEDLEHCDSVLATEYEEYVPQF